jgi:hypothetical protein
MRVLLILAAVVLLLALAGWVSFSSGPGRSSINLETDEIRQDTSEVMETGSELLNGAEDAVAPEGDPAQPAPTPVHEGP